MKRDLINLFSKINKVEPLPNLVPKIVRKTGFLILTQKLYQVK